MVKYQGYTDYQPSGVDWVGPIPSTWEMRKLGYAYDYIGSGTTPTTADESLYGGDIPWVTTGELREGIIYGTTKTVSQKTINKFPSLRIHPAGSIAIAMYGATIGRLGIFGMPATTNQACCVLPKSRHLNNMYLYYWLQAFRNDIINLSSGGGQPNINQEKVASLIISCPDLHGQKTIVAFLNYETARIDWLIAKQERLIELLKEKRQAVISHAVTKGINPDAPMKDSGVEWLGEVPAHWDVLQLKYMVSFFGGGTPSKDNEEYWNGDIPWISPKDMKRDFISDSQDKISEAAVFESSTKKIPVGAVLIVVRGMILLHSVPVGLTETEVTVNQDMKAMIVGKRIDPKYLLYLLKGLKNQLLELVDSSAHGTRVLPMDNFVRLAIPVPPVQEQPTIVSAIEQKLNKLDTTEKRALEMVVLLQEHRTALISAAVTGKADVRGWQKPNTELEEAAATVNA